MTSETRNTNRLLVSITAASALVIGGIVGFVIGSDTNDGSEPVAVGESATRGADGPTTNSTSKVKPETRSPSPTPKPTRTGPATFAVGESATVTYNNDPAGTITLESIDVSTDAPDEYSEPPANGIYLTVAVSATAMDTEQFDINPFDFYVRDDAGNRWDQGDGNAFYAVGDNDLNYTELNGGETVRGTMAFDVPAEVTQIVYAPAGRALGIWAIDTANV